MTGSLRQLSQFKGILASWFSSEEIWGGGMHANKLRSVPSMSSDYSYISTSPFSFSTPTSLLPIVLA